MGVLAYLSTTFSGSLREANNWPDASWRSRHSEYARLERAQIYFYKPSICMHDVTSLLNAQDESSYAKPFEAGRQAAIESF